MDSHSLSNLSSAVLREMGNRVLTWSLLLLCAALAKHAAAGDKLPDRGDCTGGVSGLVSGSYGKKLQCVQHVASTPPSANWCGATSWQSPSPPPSPPLVVFAEEPEDTVLCRCGQDVGKRLRCHHHWLGDDGDSAWTRSLRIQWWKDGRQLAGENGSTLQLAKCASGDAHCLESVVGSYSCQLSLSNSTVSGSIWSRTAKVSLVDSSQLRTAVISPTESFAEGTTTFLKCVVRDANTREKIPLSQMQGWRMTWSLHSRRGWGDKTVATHATLGNLSTRSVVTEQLGGGKSLTIAALADGHLLLPSVNASLLDGAAVNCYIEHQTIESTQSFRPILLQVTKTATNSSACDTAMPGIDVPPVSNLSLAVREAAALRCTSLGRVSWSVDGVVVVTGAPPQRIASVLAVLSTEHTLQLLAVVASPLVEVVCRVMAGSEGLVVVDSASTLLSIEGPPVMLRNSLYAEMAFSGNSTRLVCPLDVALSHPLPVVRWSRFGSHGNTSVDGGGYSPLPGESVVLVARGPGLFQCTASNGIGSRQHTFLLLPPNKAPSLASSVTSPLYKFVPGFDFGVTVSSSLFSNQSLDSLFIRIEYSAGQPVSYKCGCDNRPPSQDSIVLHLRSILASRCQGVAFGSVTGFQLCLNTGAQLSFNVSSPACAFSNASLSATPKQLSLAVPSGDCQKKLALVSLSYTISKCLDAWCGRTSNTIGSKVNSALEAQAHNLNVISDRVTLDLLASSSAALLSWEMYLVEMTVVTLGSTSKLFARLPALHPYPHGQVMVEPLDSGQCELFPGCTSLWSCNISWKMPNSSVWLDWGIKEVAVVLNVSRGTDSAITCIRQRTSTVIPYLRADVAYSFSLGLVASASCVDGQAQIPGHVTMTPVGTFYEPHTSTTPPTSSPCTCTCNPCDSNKYDLKFVILSGIGGLVLGLLVAAVSACVVSRHGRGKGRLVRPEEMRPLRTSFDDNTSTSDGLGRSDDSLSESPPPPPGPVLTERQPPVSPRFPSPAFHPAASPEYTPCPPLSRAGGIVVRGDGYGTVEPAAAASLDGSRRQPSDDSGMESMGSVAPSMQRDRQSETGEGSCYGPGPIVIGPGVPPVASSAQSRAYTSVPTSLPPGPQGPLMTQPASSLSSGLLLEPLDQNTGGGGGGGGGDLARRTRNGGDGIRPGAGVARLPWPSNSAQLDVGGVALPRIGSTGTTCVTTVAGSTSSSNFHMAPLSLLPTGPAPVLADGRQIDFVGNLLRQQGGDLSAQWGSSVSTSIADPKSQQHPQSPGAGDVAHHNSASVHSMTGKAKAESSDSSMSSRPSAMATSAYAASAPLSSLPQLGNISALTDIHPTGSSAAQAYSSSGRVGEIATSLPPATTLFLPRDLTGGSLLIPNVESPSASADPAQPSASVAEVAEQGPGNATADGVGPQTSPAGEDARPEFLLSGGGQLKFRLQDLGMPKQDQSD